jgi:hypothetical protein
MLPFGVTIPATEPQGPEIPEGLMNNPVYKPIKITTITYKIRKLFQRFAQPVAWLRETHSEQHCCNRMSLHDNFQHDQYRILHFFMFQV